MKSVLKKLKLINLAFLPLSTLACDAYVVGFKGLDNAFDMPAFLEYAQIVGYCARAYSWNDPNGVKFVQGLQVPYQLYGFSKGAETVAQLLKTKIKPPEYVLTIGAYKSVNLNFDSYNIRYQNYFDSSGQGQKSPGIFLNVPHMQMQREVNKING